MTRQAAMWKSYIPAIHLSKIALRYLCESILFSHFLFYFAGHNERSVPEVSRLFTIKLISGLLAIKHLQ